MQSLRRLTSSINTVTSTLNRAKFNSIRSFNYINNSQQSNTTTTTLFTQSKQLCNQSVRNYCCNHNFEYIDMTGHCHKHHEQIRIRKPAPKFAGQAVVNGEFKEISLDDFKGKYVYFFFYPLDFTFVCPTEIVAFSDAAEKFKAAGCEIVACSVDSVFSHLAWINTPRKEGGLGGINFPILSDITHQISKDYGVYIEEDGHTIRGSFIIGKDGLVKHIQMNDNPVGRNVDEALRLVQGYMYTDVHGEVCPANWNPTGNNKTMIPDPKGSKTYFEAVNK